ncbi:u2 small nuclear ribonucleoprotein B''-like protein [Phlyctochytrium arcticum]|nr:u2 small nuclear ribonucleoprotein B''-like protein [Phlyctochytrium arcticum]
MAASIPPSQTLYIRNLNEKIQKEELRKSLYYLFSQHGRVLDVVALKTMKMRGQAFICFQSISSATTALRALQEFPFFDRHMKITFAKTRSNALRFRDGAYTPGPGAERAAGMGVGGSSLAGPPTAKRPREEENGNGGENKRVKAADGTDNGKNYFFIWSECDSEEDEPMEEDEGTHPPNSILFLTNLPPTTTEQMLTMLFQQHPGYKEIRLVPGKTGIAFVEYETETQATVAKTVLDGFEIMPAHKMGVDFAKR